MLADHLQPMDTARDKSLFFQFASVLACGHAPNTAMEAIRMGKHSSEETCWRGAWHHRRGRSPKIGRENNQTDGSEGGSSHGTTSVRPHHQNWVRECGAHPSEHDGPR